jgi:hypothetical protein
MHMSKVSMPFACPFGLSSAYRSCSSYACILHQSVAAGTICYPSRCFHGFSFVSIGKC